LPDFPAKRLGAALDLSLIQAYSNFHRLMLRGKNNRVGSFRAKIELGGFVGLPDAKWGERAHAVIVPQEGTLLKETNFPIGPGIGCKRRYLDLSGGERDAAQGDRKNSAS
jgi:hypothetical protein